MADRRRAEYPAVMQSTEERARLEDIQRELVDAGLITPVGGDLQANESWVAHDAASLIESLFHVEVKPEALDASERTRWAKRIGRHFVLSAIESGDDHARRYWLMDEGVPAGTILLDVLGLGSPWQRVSSLYVRPGRRGTGIASRALDSLAAAAKRHSLAGIRLGTGWIWQKSLRFYLTRRFWVVSWKHDIQLVREPDLPERRFEIRDECARLDVLRADGWGTLLAATRESDRLVVDTSIVDPERDAIELMHYAVGTFAMLLALHGWPLVRSREQWACRWRWSDCGEPEGLAYKIGIFEGVAREAGWVVQAPRIAGLDEWQTWAEGQEHGQHEQQVRDIEAVLRARGFRLGDEQLTELKTVHDLWSLDRLLRSAVQAPSQENWLEELLKPQR